MLRWGLRGWSRAWIARDAGSGELRASSMQYGMALGMLVTFVAIVVCLCMKRARRLRQIAKRSGGVKNARSYTAYGESAGPGGGTELPDVLE